MEYQFWLRSRDIMVPLVAIVHFQSKVRFVAAQYALKVAHQFRGNYVDACGTLRNWNITGRGVRSGDTQDSRPVCPFF